MSSCEKSAYKGWLVGKVVASPSSVELTELDELEKRV
jgi:hypothetical protein